MEPALVEQRLHHVEYVVSLRPRAQIENLFGSFEGEPAFEDGGLHEGRLFPRAQQVPGPIEGELQRLVPPSPGAAQHAEAIPEAIAQLFEREGAQARGRKLDGQRQSVEQTHDLEHDRPTLPVRSELGTLRLSSLLEERYRILRQLEWLDDQHVLRRRLQPLATGRQHLELRRPLQPAADRLLGNGDHLLTVVDQQ
ncbi:MAG: hypothetical protein U0527_14515 [Candidatus Eisenbacteria bacterium]